jgi:hypothetical protein
MTLHQNRALHTWRKLRLSGNWGQYANTHRMINPPLAVANSTSEESQGSPKLFSRLLSVFVIK